MENIKKIKLAKGCIWVAFIFLVALVLIRNLALNPNIFADEFTYSLSSRLQPLHLSKISNYLYLAIFKSTNACGFNFLPCAKVLNLIFFVLAMPFIYATSRRLLSHNASICIVLLTLISPINIYTAYFVPEAMYFLFFWILVWYLLGLNIRSRTVSWLAIGALLGIGSLIKTHALFLLPPIISYMAFLSLGYDQGSRLKHFVFTSILVGVGLVVTKFGLAYLIAGNAGLSLFGHTYGATLSDFIVATKKVATEAVPYQGGVPQSASYVTNQISLSASLSALIKNWAINFGGHFLSIGILFPIALATLLESLVHLKTRNKQGLMISEYVVITSFLMIFLILVASLFTAFVTVTSHGDIYRLHIRYYNFLFPLLLILVYERLNSTTKLRHEIKDIYIKIIISATLISALVWCIFSGMRPYMPNSIDAPDLNGMLFHRGVYVPLLFCLIVLIMIWVKHERVAIKIATYFLVPLSVIVSTIGVNSALFSTMTFNVYDRAGILLKQYLTKDELSRLAVIGDNNIELSRTLFYLDSPLVEMKTVSGGVEIKPSMLPVGKNLTVVFDGHPISNDFRNQVHFNGYSLAGGQGMLKIKLQDSVGKAIDGVDYISGLSMPLEAWGAWSVDRVVTIQFQNALPEFFTLELDARAFDLNAKDSFVVNVGDFNKSFMLSNSFSRVRIEIVNQARAKVIKLIIPNPTSPQSLKQSEDVRLLGIAIREIVILW